jgi:hypothetical protein
MQRGAQGIQSLHRGRYPLPNGVTPYGLAGGGLVFLHEKGVSGGNATEGYGHLGVGVANPLRSGVSFFVQGDGFFYSLSGIPRGVLRSYSTAQFDVGWSAGLSYRLGL